MKPTAVLFGICLVLMLFSPPVYVEGETLGTVAPVKPVAIKVLVLEVVPTRKK